VSHRWGLEQAKSASIVMKIIKAVIFEPVGCLAEFRAEEFDTIATRLFEAGRLSPSGSEAYWRLLGRIEESGRKLDASEKQMVEGLELQAVEQAHLYEDVVPALEELKSLSIDLLIASSLSTAAVDRFLGKSSLASFFSAVWTRDSAGGIKAAPLAKAIESAAIPPEHAMVLVDTLDSIQVAKQAGANSILMINDYDQGKRLASQDPTGAVVSLHELPDAIRFVVENAKLLPHS
jgi:phosphoglycolate phosphatase-like HAD superfamily hydrolase